MSEVCKLYKKEEGKTYEDWYRDKKNNVFIEHFYRDASLQLDKKEYDSLRDSIKTIGQQTPITTTEKGLLLDGHYRYRICMELGIEPKVQKLSIDGINPTENIKKLIDLNMALRTFHNEIHKIFFVIRLQSVFYHEVFRELLKEINATTKDGMLTKKGTINKNKLKKFHNLKNSLFYECEQVGKELSDEMIKEPTEYSSYLSYYSPALTAILCLEQIDDKVEPEPRYEITKKWLEKLTQLYRDAPTLIEEQKRAEENFRNFIEVKN